MLGELLYEIGVEVPASQAWDLFCSLRIVELLLNLKHLIHSIELVHGDGGVGTILKLTFQDARVPAGSKSMSYSLEKITKLDHDNRVKELDVVEGGLLDMGFTLYRYRIQVFEKGAAACTIKFTIEYELPDELAATNASLVSNEILVALSDLVKDHLLSLHAGGATIN